MLTTYKLRKFEPNDLERVMMINRTCLPENYSSHFFMNIHERYPATFLVAEQDGKVIGYMMCRIETGMTRFGFFGLSKKGHVVSIAVLPEYQHKGIGVALMEAVSINLLSYKARECYLEVRVSNNKAINMYKKLGFKIARTNQSYYADGEDAYVMAKKLIK